MAPNRQKIPCLDPLKPAAARRACAPMNVARSVFMAAAISRRVNGDVIFSWSDVHTARG
jgi:hypothetical protein